MAPVGDKTSISRAWGRYDGFRVKNGLKRIFFAPAGSLRRKSVIFPDIRKVKPLIFVIFEPIFFKLLDFDSEFVAFLRFFCVPTAATP